VFSNGPRGPETKNNGKKTTPKGSEKSKGTQAEEKGIAPTQEIARQ